MTKLKHFIIQQMHKYMIRKYNKNYYKIQDYSKSVKHFKYLQQINYSMDHGSS